MLICAPVKTGLFIAKLANSLSSFRYAQHQPLGQGGIIIVEALEIIIKSASQ
jgi:hypothetical protein